MKINEPYRDTVCVRQAGLVDGQSVTYQIVAVGEKPALRPALMETWEEDVEAYRYLAER
jgi:hypothetical protein